MSACVGVGSKDIPIGNVDDLYAILIDVGMKDFTQDT